MVHYTCQYAKAIDYFKHSRIKKPSRQLAIWNFSSCQQTPEACSSDELSEDLAFPSVYMTSQVQLLTVGPGCVLAHASWAGWQGAIWFAHHAQLGCDAHT